MYVSYVWLFLSLLPLMTVRSNRYQTCSFHQVANCEKNKAKDSMTTFRVTSRTECAKICSEHSDCQSVEVYPPADDREGRICSLYRTHWTQGSCTPSTSRYNKFGGCYNSGVLEDGKCRCVGGYVGTNCKRRMRDCDEGYKGLYRRSGVYTVWPRTAPSPFKVYCRMSKRGQTIIQLQTVDGGVNFNRTWNEYDVGFGNISGDHWLGNTHIHHLTQKNPAPALTVSITAGGERKLRYYFRFNLTDKTNNFRFSYKWSETEPEKGNQLGDCLGRMREYGFSTFDNDNDGKRYDNCAQIRGSGWWFQRCMKCDLNAKVTGPIYDKPSDVNWIPGLNQSAVITSTLLYLSR